jgi:hypothetical protein
MSMEQMGTADASTVSSPVMGSDKEHWEDIFPVTRNPPIQQYLSSEVFLSKSLMIPPLMREILVNISLIRGEMMGLTDTKYSLRSKKGHHLDKIFL